MKLPFSLFLEEIPKRILCLICLLTFFISCQQKIGIDEEPRCLTEAATDLTMTTATINGKVVGLPQGKSISEACFYFSSDISSVDSLVNMGEWLLIAGTNLSFSYTLQNLMPNQRYYYVAAVIVAGEEMFGEVNSFTTMDLLVETEESQNLTISNVELFGKTIDIPSSMKDVKYGFETGSNKTNLFFQEGELLDDGIFTRSIYLPNSDSCYYRACVQYNGISYYGETKSLRVPEFNVKVETKDAVQVQHVTAIVNGLLLSDNTSDYELCFYYTRYESDIKNGRISGNREYAGNSSVFNAGITGLTPGKQYYYQAVVRRGYREAYGDIKSFTTKEYSYSSCEPVDLGLSVKWSSTNVGAPSPEYYGIPVAWGEIQTKRQFRDSNYKWCNGTLQSLKKYNISPEYGPVDNKLQLELEDDVAHVLVGSNWRIPSFEEAIELCDNCVWEWGVLNGIEGCYIKSKVNGNSIFLPATGVYETYNNSEVPLGGYAGYYWTSSITPQIYMKSSNTATSIYFWRTRIGRVEVNSQRSRGEFVRPVMIEP